jgi:hypothetical protein
MLGETLSFMTIADTRIKALECAVQALTFIFKNFGKTDRTNLSDWSSLTNILKNVKAALRKESNKARVAQGAHYDKTSSTA